jgi:peptidoglycan/xylan/chitin deacetylase (PgdA/CDA1 family)/glycosyltransferase involved in cell wall biosynthesis
MEPAGAQKNSSWRRSIPGSCLISNLMNAIKLSVVIPTFNRRHVLARTVPTLLAQDFPAENYELIFAVDGSSDGTLGMLRALNPRCALQVLELPHLGPGAARNKGIAAARGGLLLFLDDDIIAPACLFRYHCAAHPSLDPLVVHGPIYVAPDSPKTLIRYSTEAWYQECYRPLDPAVGLRFPLTASSLVNSSMPRDILLASGGFDEETPSAEDLELGLRLWRGGAQFRYLPAAPAYELFVKSSREYVEKQTGLSARGEIYVCRKHSEYRPHSGFARLGLLTGWKQLLKSLATRSPLSPLPLFTLPLWTSEHLCRFAPIRRAGIRLLEVAASTTLHRAALREVGSWKALQSEFGMRLPVLLYHHVGPPRPGTYASLTVSRKRFERQLRWLARRGYAGISPSDWLRWRREGKGLPDKPVLLTFDDGYADLAEYALPVLKRYGFRAVVFVVTGRVGGTNIWDEARGSGTLRLMTADQIRYWATQGIEFGAHGRTHTDLTTLDPKELTEEVIGSRNDLAGILGGRVTSFAYPYGFYNQAACECVRGAFDLAFRGDEETPGINLLGASPHLLQRTMVQPGDTLLDLECRVRWGYSPLLNLRIRLRGLFMRMFFGAAEKDRPHRAG